MISRAQLVYSWRAANARLKEAKAAEMRWRMLIASELFPEPLLGTNTNGNVKLIAKQNYSLCKDHTLVINAIERISKEYPDVAVDTIVDWSPRLSGATYEALPEAAQKIFADVLTIKPATPTVKYNGEGDDE